MAENVDNQTILNNNVKTYTLTAKSTAAQVFTIAQAFVSGHIRLNAGAASAEVLQQFKDFVSALRGDTKDQEKKQDDDKKSDSKTSQTVSLKIGGLTSTWTYDFKDFEEHSFDQIGAAQRLADMCEGHVAYDSDRDEWRAWNSQRWVWINSSLNQLTQLTREVLSCILTEAQLRFPSGFEDIKKKIEGLATQPKMIQILKLAQTEDLLGVSNVRYNSYNYLINTINGEVNIQTGELQKHDKKHLFTKIVPYRYNPKAHSNLWDDFLNVTFQNNQSMIDYFQIATGDSALSGVNTDRHLYIVFGQGHDGKSVALSAIRHVLGGDSQDRSGFADTADISTFLKKRSASGAVASPDLAGLDGVRFVTPTEPGKGDQLDEGLIKSLTGKSDTMKVRNLYSSAFTLYSQFSIWIAANDVPKSSASQAIMDRLIIVPFSHRIKPNGLEDNPQIESQLAKTKNMEGILNWLVQGSIKATQKRQQAAQAAATARKNGDIDEVIFQDPLRPYPIPVVKARNKYQYSANSSLAFIYDVLYSQSEAMQIVIDSMLSNDETLRYLEDGIDAHPMANNAIIAKQIFSEIRLVFDPTSYITKTDLYNLYRDWARSEGMRNVATKRSFHDSISQILCEGRQKSLRVWLGLGLMPIIGHEGYNVTLNIGSYRGWLKSTSKKYDNDHLVKFAKKDGAIFTADQPTQTTDTVRDQLKNFIELNPSSYGNRRTIDRSDVKWPDPITTTKPTVAQSFAHAAYADDDEDKRNKAKQMLNNPNITEEEKKQALDDLFAD